MTHPQRILIVNDDEHSKPARAALEQRGFEVALADGIEAAYGQLLDSAFALVIIDVASAEEAVKFVKRLRATPKLSKTFVLTLAKWGTGQPTMALSEGADAYEPKPVDAPRLVAAVEKLLRQRVARTAAARSSGIETDE